VLSHSRNDSFGHGSPLGLYSTGSLITCPSPPPQKKHAPLHLSLDSHSPKSRCCYTKSMLRGSINHTSGVRIEMYQSFRKPCEIALGKYAQRASVCRSVSPVDHCARVIGELSSAARGTFTQRAELDRPPVAVAGHCARTGVLQFSNFDSTLCIC